MNEVLFNIGDTEVWIQEVTSCEEQQEDGSFIEVEGNWTFLRVSFDGINSYDTCVDKENLEQFLFAIGKGEDEFRKTSKELEDIEWV